MRISDCKHKALTHYHGFDDVGPLVYWVTECKKCGAILDRHVVGECLKREKIPLILIINVIYS